MLMNIFGNSSSNSDNKNDTSFFVQKPYLKTNYIEANIEEDFDLKNQYRIKNLPDLISIREPGSKKYNDTKYKDAIIIKNTAHIDLNDTNITNARFIQVNQLPQIDSHLTARLCVDNAIDELGLVRNNLGNDFNINNLTHIYSITLNKQAENAIEVITKAYVDQFHQENERSRRDLSIDFYDESNDLVKNNQANDFNDIKLTFIDSITVNRRPTSDNELSSEKYIEDEWDKNTILRFNQALQNYLKVSVGNYTYKLAKYDKKQLSDVTKIKFPKTGVYLLQNWAIQRDDWNSNSKTDKFRKSTKTNNQTGDSGSTSLPPISYSFMFFETSKNNYGNGVFVSFERTDIIQITNITFYYNRFSILTDGILKNLGRFRIQLLLEDNTWSTQYAIGKNIQYSNTSTEWWTFFSIFYHKEFWYQNNLWSNRWCPWRYVL